jgi:hypothetical protein
MKLTKELKERIDNYFDNITPEELFDISISRYNFTCDNNTKGET